jgi:hypothetical protein
MRLPKCRRKTFRVAAPRCHLVNLAMREFIYAARGDTVIATWYVGAPVTLIASWSNLGARL